MVNRKWAWRAVFESEEEAARAYDAAVWRLKPGDAKSFINFPEERPPKKSQPPLTSQQVQEVEVECTLKEESMDEAATKGSAKGQARSIVAGTLMISLNVRYHCNNLHKTAEYSCSRRKIEPTCGCDCIPSCFC